MLFFAGITLIILCMVVAAWYIRDALDAIRAPRLTPSAHLPTAGPLISIIVPARDEAARIGQCLEGLARQSYRSFELIVVDDHSVDGTGVVARSFAPRLPALRVLSGARLPKGWAGKCWACWQGARVARGGLLLFLDADVAPQPDLLAAMVRQLETRPIDLLTLVPLIRLDTLAEVIVLPAFVGLISTVYPLAQVNDPRSPLAFAIGQCILVRRSVYDALDGHRAVRGSVLEDMELARLVKGAGHRLEALVAPKLIEVRMYSGWSALAEGLTKNAVAGFRSGGRRAIWAGVRQLIMVALPFDLLASAAWLTWAEPARHTAGLLALAGTVLLLVGMAAWGTIVAVRHRASAMWGLLFPLGAALYYWLAAVALLRLRSGKGLVWKGRVFTR